MAKPRIVFYCSNCGVSSPKWIGKCPSCQEWNTYHEEIITKESKAEVHKKSWSSQSNSRSSALSKIKEIPLGKILRIQTQNKEFDRVMGGGIVRGSLVLIGGQPGIGKSTLLLQIALNLKNRILYVSGEESEEQLKMRANRIGIDNEECYISTETNVSKLLTQAQKLTPDLIIIDSIQTLASPFMDSTPGSVSQIRECTAELQRFAKETHISVIIIGHITKDGNIAGPKLLEHMVDVVLQFEGDQNYSYRVVRTLKNRFGSTDELGIFEMQSTGLREISNPSELLLSQTDEQLSGSAIASTIEGMRPMLIETQALVTRSVYGTPQRSCTGFDLRRLSMLLAVLEKRCGLPLGMQDVFLNIAGGIKVKDPAIDLAIVSALISSLEDIYIDKKTCFAGEVGLSGEVRAVSRIEQRIIEADRMGFEQIIISKNNLKSLNMQVQQVKIIGVSNLNRLMSEVFG